MDNACCHNIFTVPKDTNLDLERKMPYTSKLNPPLFSGAYITLEHSLMYISESRGKIQVSPTCKAHY